MIANRLERSPPRRWIHLFALVVAAALSVAASDSSDASDTSDPSDAPQRPEISNSAAASEPSDGATLDTDADGQPDFQDNCIAVANTVEPMLQGDSDRDGFGNACDGDFDQTGMIDLRDFSVFLGCLQGRVGSEDDPACKESDMNGDGAVSDLDFELFSAGLASGRPGPSGLACVEGALTPIPPIPPMPRTPPAPPRPNDPSEISRGSVPCVPARVSDAPLP